MIWHFAKLIHAFSWRTEFFHDSGERRSQFADADRPVLLTGYSGVPQRWGGVGGRLERRLADADLLQHTDENARMHRIYPFNVGKAKYCTGKESSENISRCIQRPRLQGMVSHGSDQAPTPTHHATSRCTSSKNGNYYHTRKVFAFADVVMCNHHKLADLLTPHCTYHNFPASLTTAGAFRRTTDVTYKNGGGGTFPCFKRADCLSTPLALALPLRSQTAKPHLHRRNTSDSSTASSP